MRDMERSCRQVGWVVGFFSVCISSSSTAWAAEVPVTDATELLDAIANASPGDEIILSPGVYNIGNKVNCSTPGTLDEPIIVRSATPLAAEIKFDTVEGFAASAAHWQFLDLDIEGVCADDNTCEHAFHITGAADNVLIRGVRAHGFNAHIKGNGAEVGMMGERVFPDDVVVEYNEFFNPAPRNTGNPVTPIDVVGGYRWIIRGNFIHDHAKGGGNGVSYAAFLKGNSRDGLFERNLIACEWLHQGQIRLGLSFGGGGSGPDNICEDGTCTPEHQNGIMRNNLILNCPSDVGIYINEGQNSRIYNNTLFATTGIDMRFPATTGEVRNNLLMGKIRERDGSSFMKSSNVEDATLGDFMAWFTDPAQADFSLLDGAVFVDQGEFLDVVTDDYCTNDRNDGTHDIGALEYDGDPQCATEQPFIPPDDPSDSDSDSDTTDGTTDGTTDTTDGTTGEPTTGGESETTTTTDTGSDSDQTTSDGTTAGPTTGDDTTTLPTTGDGATAGTGATPTDSGMEEGGEGCGCNTPGQQPLAWFSASLLVWIAGRRRRAQE